jgi:hypothetical protein
MTTSDDILSAWMEVERVLQLLPVGHPHRDAVRRAADALDEAYHDALGGHPAGLDALSRETIGRSVIVVGLLRSEGAVTLADETQGVLTDVERYLARTRPPIAATRDGANASLPTEASSRSISARDERRVTEAAG